MCCERLIPQVAVYLLFSPFRRLLLREAASIQPCCSFLGLWNVNCNISAAAVFHIIMELFCEESYSNRIRPNMCANGGADAGNPEGVSMRFPQVLTILYILMEQFV